MVVVDKEGFPLSLVIQVIVHQHWEIILLNVGVNIVVSHNAVDVLQGTDRVIGSWLEVRAVSHGDTADPFAAS